MGGDLIKWVLDLDVTKFKENISKAGDELSKLGDEKNLSGLVGSFEGLAQSFLAFEGVKILGDLTVKAGEAALEASLLSEEIRTTQIQFTKLAEGAGIASKELEEGLKKAADGLVDDNELLQEASKGIVALGKNAQKLPELFEIARKASSTFGGTTMERLGQIEMAIQSGNTRLLKQVGLWFNAEDAVKKFAHAHGLQVAQLSDEAKQQAILNGVLEKSQKQYADIDVNQRKLSNNLDRLKVGLTELKEASAIALDKYLGPSINKIVEYFAKATTGVTSFIKEFVGIETPTEKVKRLSDEIAIYNENVKHHPELITVSEQERIANYQKQLAQIQNQQNIMAAEEEEKRKRGGGAPAGDQSEGLTKEVDPQEKAKAQATYYQELAKLREENAQAEEKSAQDILQWTMAKDAERAAIDETYAAQKQAKQEELKINYFLSEQQKMDIIEQMDANHKQRLMEMDTQYQNERIKKDKEFRDKALETSDTFAAGWKRAAIAAGAETKKFQALGTNAFNAVAHKGADAFMALGEGSKTGTEIMRGFFFGALADIAENQGKIMLAQGLTGNAAAAAAGAGLLVLAGFLRSQAKGGSSGSPSVDTGSGGGGDTGTSSSITPSSESGVNMADQTPRKHTTVQIAGPIITDETKTRFLEIMRQATDDTDYKYQQIGVG